MNKSVVHILVLCVLFVLPAAAQNAPATCEVKVSTPQPGDKVGRDGRVRGTAKIPTGTYLWVLSHMKDLTEEWWPQGGRPASINPQSGEWVIIAAYGRAEDVKEDFEVAVVVVDSNTNSRLRDWFKDAKAKDYPAMDFPTPIDGCLPIKVVVHKTSH
jgi:hypothetical protein